MITGNLRRPGPARPRRSPRASRGEIAGLVAGFAIGLTLMFALGPLRPGGGPGQPGSGRQPGAGSAAVPAPAVGPVPAGLDADWAAVSAQSTCAGWAGGDGISAVRLDSAQVAWFFSDTYLGPAGPATGFSHSSGLVHNSVVVQTAGAQGSRFTTLTGGHVCSLARRAASVVAPPRAPGRPSTRYWAEDGVKIGGSVLKFYNRFSPGNVPYVPLGTVIADYSADGLAAAGRGTAGSGVVAPRLTALPSYVPPGADSPIVWGDAVLRVGDTVYVYGTDLPETALVNRQLFLARVPAGRLADFGAWRFSAGPGRWAAAQRDARPLTTAGASLNVSSGFSVIQAGRRYWLIQADPVAGSQDIDAYPAPAPWGPFDQSAGTVLYRDPGIGLDAAHDYRLMYEARAEPAVSPSGTLVISYNVNSTGNSAGCVPMSWFTNTVTLPRFISLPLAALGAGGSRAAQAVTTGPPDFPRVAARDPGQWFDEWNYPGGCPPVPELGTVAARPRPGTVTLSWPDAGLGLAYQVYLRTPGAAHFTLRSTVYWVLTSTARPVTATLSGLPPGKYQAKVVPMNLRLSKGRPAVVSFLVPAAGG